MKKWTVGKVLYWVLAAIFSLIFIYPIYFTVISSFKNKVVEDSQGHVLLTYTPLEKTMEKLPEPAKVALDPEKILTNEELYLTGLHIEQYRHATYDPDPYYPGNLYYDKKQYDLAMELWEQSRQMDDTFPPVFRNLALGAYNKEKDPEKARELMEKAFSLNKKDSRTFLELDQLYKKMGFPIRNGWNFMIAIRKFSGKGAIW